MLACGSNQSPQQLSIKFSGLDIGPTPVIRARLRDFDSVYSAHFSRYGSIPATLQHAPGTTVFVFVLWLTSGQREHMHKTEAVGVNYDFGRLDDIDLRMDGGGVLDHVFSYISRRGCLTWDGLPVPLSAIKAEGRRWPALTQEQVLEVARDRLEPGHSLDDFISGTITDKEIRNARTKALESGARPFEYHSVTPA